MKVIFKKEAEQEFRYWQKKNTKISKKIVSLIQNIQVTPYNGLGKAESLKHELSGAWSRRINGEHRLIYSVSEADGLIIILSCKGHYNN